MGIEPTADGIAAYRLDLKSRGATSAPSAPTDAPSEDELEAARTNKALCATF